MTTEQKDAPKTCCCCNGACCCAPAAGPVAAALRQLADALEACCAPAPRHGKE